MGVNTGILVKIVSRSFGAVQAAVDDLLMKDLPGGEYKYAEFLQFKYTASSDSMLVKAEAETVHRVQFAMVLLKELERMQKDYPDVFFAEYEYDAEYDHVGTVMTGVKCWRLNLGDQAVMDRIAEVQEDTVSGAYIRAKRIAKHTARENSVKAETAAYSQVSVLDQLRQRALDVAALEAEKIRADLRS